MIKKLSTANIAHGVEKSKLIQMNALDKKNTSHSRANVQQHFHDEYISSGICNYLHGERDNKTTNRLNDDFKRIMGMN